VIKTIIEGSLAAAKPPVNGLRTVHLWVGEDSANVLFDMNPFQEALAPNSHLSQAELAFAQSGDVSLLKDGILLAYQATIDGPAVASSP
jgi:hypothetical protein